MGSENSTEKKPCGCDINVPYSEPRDRLQQFYVCLDCKAECNIIFDKQFAQKIKNKTYKVLNTDLEIENYFYQTNQTTGTIYGDA